MSAVKLVNLVGAWVVTGILVANLAPVLADILSVAVR